MTAEEVMIKQSQLNNMTPQQQVDFWCNKMYDMNSRSSNIVNIRFVQSLISEIQKENN